MGVRAGAAAGVAIVLALARPGVAASVDGPALYRHWCARCHGENGDGRGPAAAALASNGRPPRDFTTGRMKITSVPAGQAPTDADLARSIAVGLPETSMPYFEDLLTREQISALVAVVRGFAARPAPPGTPIDLGPEPPGDAEGLARGAEHYVTLGCAVCHGDGGRGDGVVAAQLKASDGTKLVPTDLTRPWAFRGGSEPADVAMRLAAGIAGTPMPSYLDVASTADLWDVAHYVRSLAQAPSLAEAALARARVPHGAGETPLARGEYLSKSGTCFLCHARMNEDGSYVADAFAAGGMRVEITHGPTLYTRNLTPDAETGLGKWTPADLGRALRDGRTPSGRRLNPLDMPWPILAEVADADVNALHAYLASLPPVKNPLPTPRAPSLVSAVGGKVLALLTGRQMAGVYFPGSPPRRDDAQAWPDAESRVALVSLAVLAAYAGLRRGRRSLETVGVTTLLVLVPLLYAWPPLSWMPPALVRADGAWAGVGSALGLPPVRPAPSPVGMATDDAAILAERGRYVATVGTCSLCHTAGPDPLRLWQPVHDMAGGMRVTWRVFGTTYSRNLTPDRETGLGAWSDAEIRRAITSGIARDGRLMHWQAMPWDHFSNLRLEDLHALIAYLRHLPAVRSTVPPPAPPSPSDAAADTFSFGYTGRARP